VRQSNLLRTQSELIRGNAHADAMSSVPGKTVRLESPGNGQRATKPPRRIAISVSRKVIFLDPSEIVSAEAKGNYVELHHSTASYIIREPIAKLEEALSPHGFVRIHRSVLINAGFVREFMRTTGGECLIRTDCGKEYRVSRTYKRNIRFLAESWLGSTLDR